MKASKSAKTKQRAVSPPAPVPTIQMDASSRQIAIEIDKLLALYENIVFRSVEPPSMYVNTLGAPNAYCVYGQVAIGRQVIDFGFYIRAEMIDRAHFPARHRGSRC